MTSHATRPHRYNKGITQTFYTILIAFISIGLLMLIFVLFIQKNYDIRLTIQETEQDRAVINLGQALLSSNKIVYVDIDGVVHRDVVDAEKAKNVNVDDIRKDFGYTDFYYTLTITDLDKKADLKSPTPAESATQIRFRENTQKREFPIAIKNIDGTTDAGVMTIVGGFSPPPGD